MTEISKEDVFAQVRDAMVELFELNADNIRGESRLIEDLDLDSIDAVDLIVHLQDATGKKIKPEEFWSVKTVDDVVDAIHRMLKAE